MAYKLVFTEKVDATPPQTVIVDMPNMTVIAEFVLRAVADAQRDPNIEVEGFRVDLV